MSLNEMPKGRPTSGPFPKKTRLVFSVLTNTEKMADIVHMAKESHAESRFSYIEFAPEKVQAIAERAIADPKRHAVMMAWQDEMPVGFAYCSVGEYHIGTGALVTTIHV